MTEKLTILPGLLATARLNANLTQAKLAEAINEYNGSNTVQTPRISNWENGERKVPSKYNDAIAHALHTTIESLAGISENDNNSSTSYTASFPKAEVSFHDITNYNGCPIYVEMKDLSYKSGWGLVDTTKSCIVMLNRNIPFRQLNTNSHILYRYLQIKDNFNKPIIDKNTLLNTKDVFVSIITFDNTLSAMYNGWYHHNENKTALINDIGLLLPYSGLNQAYKAYSKI